VNEENLLDPPTRLEDVLESFDHAEYFLMQVKEEDDDSLPLCKIIHRRTYLEKEKARTILARQNRTIIKQMEINWAIDAHDFSHRKKQLTKFLEKDCKVEITLTTKKRKRAPTVEEIKQTVQGVLDTIKAAGARQTSEMEGELGKQLKITARKVKMEGKDKVQGEEQAKSEK
jgi:translation initiation factor IF-3